MIPYKYVETQEQLKETCEELNKHDVIGVDIECENNLHHYGAYISIIQLTAKSHHWIIDVLALKEINCLLKVLKNPDIQKIFHDVSFDFRILNYQFKCVPMNVFDSQLAALYLGYESIGLASLLKEFFDVKKEEKYQMADWTKRPLDEDMLSYATKDSKYLIKLRNILREKLRQMKRISWVEEEFKLLEGKEWEHVIPTYLNVRGIRQLSEKELAIFKRLFLLREKLAEKVNRPVHYIINSKKLLELAQRPPKNWGELKGVHPVVKKSSKLFKEAVEKGKKEIAIYPYSPKQRMKAAQKDSYERLVKMRDVVAEKLSLPGHLILNKEQMISVATTGKFDSVHKWQRELLKI